MPTRLRAGGAHYPEQRNGCSVPRFEGCNLLPVLRGETASERTLFWERKRNCAVRRERFKLVRRHDQPWELSDMATDRAGRDDLAGKHPNLVAELADRYEEWAFRSGVIPYERILESRA
jgi:arylsulfatase A-like enzyme